MRIVGNSDASRTGILARVPALLVVLVLSSTVSCKDSTGPDLPDLPARGSFVAQAQGSLDEPLAGPATVRTCTRDLGVPSTTELILQDSLRVTPAGVHGDIIFSITGAEASAGHYAASSEWSPPDQVAFHVVAGLVDSSGAGIHLDTIDGSVEITGSTATELTGHFSLAAQGESLAGALTLQGDFRAERSHDCSNL